MFYIGALFAFGIFVDGLIVFFADRRRRARDLSGKSPTRKKSP